jgi:ANTAR domain
MGERAVSVWAWIAAAHDGVAPVSVGALCRAAVLRLGVDGASVTAMSGPVAREPVHASDDVSARLEELQFTTGEGPGTDDFRLGSPMLLAELASVAGRWPGFVPAALAAGARAIFSFPLQAGAIRVGILSLYRARSGPLTVEQLANALVFADIALRLLLDVSFGMTEAPGYRLLDGLSETRAEVHQATGMISVQLGVSLEEAFVRLRAHAFASNTALGAVAGEVVRRRLRFGPPGAESPGSAPDEAAH